MIYRHFSAFKKITALCLLVTLIIVAANANVFAGTPSDLRPDISPLPHISASAARIQQLLNIIFGLIGAVALLMVVIGGVRYIMSQGDPQAAAKAKSTIINALIGLLVAILAVAITTFIVGSL